MSVLASGAPNDRMFPNTSEVSQMVRFVLRRKTNYLFECLRGTLAISKVLGGFLVSSETILMGSIESLRKWSSRTIIRKF